MAEAEVVVAGCIGDFGERGAVMGNTQVEGCGEDKRIEEGRKTKWKAKRRKESTRRTKVSDNGKSGNGGLRTGQLRQAQPRALGSERGKIFLWEWEKRNQSGGREAGTTDVWLSVMSRSTGYRMYACMDVCRNRAMGGLYGWGKCWVHGPLGSLAFLSRGYDEEEEEKGRTCILKLGIEIDD